MTDLSSVPAKEYSCATSLAVGEPLAGSGTLVKQWLLLEFDTPWQARALPASDLADPVKQKLIAFETENEGARVQLFRGFGEIHEQPRLLLARSDQPERPLQRLRLSSYQEILQMDFNSILEQPVPEEQQADPILIVCTNGLRDLCCARFGTAAFQALSKLEPKRVFQTTHIGGHRFAANGIWLPYGITYGRLQPETAVELLTLMNAGNISLENYRGRTTMPKPAQAADHFLRQQDDLLGVEATSLQSIEGQDPTWQVTFLVKPTQETKTIEIEYRPGLYQVIKTTGDSETAMTGHYHCRFLKG